MDGGIGKFTVIYFMIFISVDLSLQTIPSEKKFEEWSESLGKKIKGYADNDWHKIIRGNYNSLLNDVNVEVKENVLKTMVRHASEDIELVLGKKMEALRRSVKVAEDVAAKYKWNSSLKIDDVPFTDTKKIINNVADTGYVLSYNERFKQEVNTSVSAVHIPVEIYEGSIDILNGLKWTEALDEVFEKNYHEDEEILWQYFGSQTGFMRTLPASAWNRKEGSVDLFDVRRQPWYTQGSSSPKDMLILVDKSGSVHGQALQLIKVAVKSLLDTLGENDFVNIAEFSSHAKYVGCFETFVQANHRNKKILSEAVDGLEAYGMADFSVGLTFAFEAFLNFSANSSQTNQGANCNKMIMVLTDGGTETAQEVFDKYNPKENPDVRVFSYAVGPIANPVSSIRWMACRNRGWFSLIPAMGAIRAKVQGLGMITTVTLPVYNRTNLTDGASNQTILGVMGIDVQTKELEKHTPKRKLGPNGYSFAINLNGYVIFHPNLKTQKAYEKDPPNVDLLEIEVEDEKKEEVRRLMIDREETENEITGMVIAPDKRHIYEVKRKYGFKGIENSTFSLGMVQPEYAKYSFGLKKSVDLSNIDGDKFSSQHNSLLIAPWDYYEGLTEKENRTGTTEDLKSVLSQKGVEWNDDLLKGLYFDLLAISKLTAFQTDLHSLTDSLASFVATLGGLTLVHPKEATEYFENRMDTWTDVFYRRILDSETFIFEAPYTLTGRTENDTLPPIFAGKAITVYKDGHPIKPAVTGTVFDHDRFQEKIIKSTEQECSDPEKLLCYVLDNGGFLIATNSDEKKKSIGRFFGYVDSLIMEDLVNTSVYKSYTSFDYQGECNIADDDNVNAGPMSVKIPSINWIYDLLSLNWWTSTLTWSFLNFNIYNWIFSTSTQYVHAVVEEKELCTQIQTQYYFNNPTKDGLKGRKVIKGIVYCNNCTRDYLAGRIVDSNLLFVVTDPECSGCINQKTYLIQEPARAVGENSPPDQCKKIPRYRRRPNENSCYKSDNEEDTTKCAGWSVHLTSYWVLAASSFFLILTSYFLSFVVL